eukprot:TRINITY_DN51781_c0_g1_i1.p1 TRINITY_DN51781_c0_g1~~TRINITY_DN51781_c0_g1_i1.p1  ORF type:complete len:299 (+),score=77.49 TRINITY_DN51781_c0_g1_i1:68-898(+)
MPLSMPGDFAELVHEQFSGEEGSPRKQAKTVRGKGRARQLPEHLWGDLDAEDGEVEQAHAGSAGSARRLVPPKPGRQPAASRRGMREQVVDEAIEVLGDLLLECKQDAREVKGFSERTVLVPGNLACVEAALATERQVAKMRQEKRGQNLGSAHIPIAIKFLSMIPDTADFAEEKTLLESLKQFWKEIVLKLPKAELPFHIQVFRVSKPKKASKEVMGGNYARLSFRFAPPDHLQSLASKLEVNFVMTCKNLGWEVKCGTPPKTAKQRRLLDMLGR